MPKKEIDRRSFLHLSGIGMLSAMAGCHGALYRNLGMDCYHSSRLEDKVRVMSYNIGNARGDYDDFWKVRSKDAIQYNLGMIGAMCQHEGIDVLCMNEVDFDSARSQHIDQAEYIAKHLCFNHVIKERIFSVPGMIDVGNAVVSRYPLRLNTYRQYGGDNAVGRIKHVCKSYVDFDVIIGKGRSLNFVLTHLDHYRESTRNEEVTMLLAHLEKKRQPFVLLGDFNSGPGHHSFDRLIRSGLVHNRKAGILTFRSHRPTDSKDHILVSPQLRIKDYRAIWAEMSDHRPVVGDIWF